MSIEILLGTYTRGESDGIYKVYLNSESKKLEDLSLIAKIGSPTYLAQDDRNNILYSIVAENEEGGIASLVKDEDENYIRQSVLLADGAAPAYISYDEKNNFIYSSNYHRGELSVYRTDDKGKLELLDTVKHSGSSVHKNQTSPHVHYTDLTPDGKYLAVCDLGTDEVYSYKVSDDGKLSENSRLKLKPGSGPRHLAFHPNGKIAYVIAELSNELIVLDYDTDTGKFTEKQTISSIPENYSEFSAGGAIRVTKDGKFVYASNRGHDSIATFSTEDDGKLALVDLISTEGDFPRDFNLDPSEKFLIVGHQDSDNLTLFERNEEDGQLTLLQKDFYAPEVVNLYI